MKGFLIAGNWKMNRGGKDGALLARDIKMGTYSIKDGIEIMIAPPFTAIPSVSEILNGSKVKLGAQNMYFEDKGAYTGEISPQFLLDFGVEFIILGHSERRQYFCEKDEDVRKKVKKALEVGLKPIICVGETLEQRDSGEAKNIVVKQVRSIVEGMEEVEKLTFAYEPIWAIGTGRVASPEQADEMHRVIRNIIGDKGDDVRILYGGSVKPNNAESLLKMDNIDGALIGGASLKTEDFINIIKIAEKML
ncbi:triose-phosphate isomerase [candidate division WOR-3 bacterium]|nr:triose-phosphate isomerase [candidate division WOR-3 bacterium]